MEMMVRYFTFQKQSTASTADICKKIETTMEKLEGENENLRFTTLMNQGIYIDIIINSALDNLILWSNTCSYNFICIFKRL